MELVDLLNMCNDCGCVRYPFCNVNGKACSICKHQYLFEQAEEIKETVNFKTLNIKANGDCLFECISRAFNQCFSIEELRDSVAREQTEETLSTYKALEDLYFPYMKYIHNLSDFKSYIRKRGMYFGWNKCYMGDENALRIIANNLGIRIAVYNNDYDDVADEELYELKHIIGTADDALVYIMLLYIEQKIHYRIITWGDNKFFAKGQPQATITMLRLS